MTVPPKRRVHQEPNPVDADLVLALVDDPHLTLCPLGDGDQVSRGGRCGAAHRAIPATSDCNSPASYISVMMSLPPMNSPLT